MPEVEPRLVGREARIAQEFGGRDQEIEIPRLELAAARAGRVVDRPQARLRSTARPIT